MDAIDTHIEVLRKEVVDLDFLVLLDPVALEIRLLFSDFIEIM